MRWVIKNGAPSGHKLMKWGDYHFGRSLTKELEALGQSVSTDYDPGWDNPADCDVVLVLRGKYPFADEGRAVHPGALRMMWNISHPASVMREEYDTYDLVFVASHAWARSLRRQIATPVFPLLQCTDTDEFSMAHARPAGDRRGVPFVGNSRYVERTAPIWAADYGLAFDVWGRGWRAWPDVQARVRGDYFPNEELGKLYGRSRWTINDHWPDMASYGFVNNRIFDALACGLPVLSDWSPELQELDLGGVLVYGDRAEFDQRIGELLLEYPRAHAAAQETARQVRDTHSFRARAGVLVELADTARRLGPNAGSARNSGERNAASRGVRATPGPTAAFPHACPVCGAEVDFFRPFGANKRPNAKCPSCGALERHRLIWLYLLHRTNFFDGSPKSVLHISPEKYLSSLVWDVPGVDYRSADLDSPTAMETLDLTAAQYEDAAFDVILCNHVMEHIPDDHAAMREMARMLKPGGWAIAQVPMRGETTDEDLSVTDPQERLKRFGQEDHVRMYGRDYEARLAAAGLEVTQERFAAEVGEEVAQYYGLSTQPIYLCRVAARPRGRLPVASSLRRTARTRG